MATFAEHIIGPDIHANRPAAAAVPAGTVYACTTHSKLEQSDGASWIDYFSGGGGGAAAFKGCRVYNSGNISVANNTEVFLTFDTETFDTDTMHSTGSNTGRIVAVTAGYYTVGMNVRIAANGAGSRNLNIYATTTAPVTTQVAEVNYAVPPSGSDTFIGECEGEWFLGVGDYFTFSVYQNSGSTLNAVASAQKGICAWAGLLGT